ncbi:hypothetical protein CABS01_10696 [Colletotrichum abscissum]|uniref:uncharacterized protein n=1 Tax=Colletotrichum abscissum TaxID=1671311 RepID=UPI0027D6F841|nr:uncharacterized protein CABS01_10696 [Colletotrichum abscissum]KAK1497718.1 hypothetical protein CABS01_10696 [Colletotrichum abscissum]
MATASVQESGLLILNFADRGAPKWLGGAQTAQRTSEAQRAGHLALRIMSGFAGSAEDQAKEPSVGDGAVGM